MARVEQWVDSEVDATPVPLSTVSTFNGTLEQFAFQAPTSASPLQKFGQLPSTALTPSTSRKRKAVDEMLPLITKRITRSSTTLRPSLQPTTISPSTKLTHQPPSPSPAPSKRKRPSSSYASPSKYAHLPNHLTDSLAPSLICVFIGVNPGLRTAALGHAYAHPSNLFWKLLHSSGCTDRRCLPSEDHDLPRLYALGQTNIVTRATKDAAELSRAEMDAGVAVLERKMGACRPEAVCLVGKSIWESVWRATKGRGIRKEEFRYGWQEERMGAGEGWVGARIFVATSTSGLAAGMRPKEKEEVWRGLGEWVKRRRGERDAEGMEEGRGGGEEAEAGADTTAEWPVGA